MDKYPTVQRVLSFADVVCILNPGFNSFRDKKMLLSKPHSSILSWLHHRNVTPVSTKRHWIKVGINLDVQPIVLTVVPHTEDVLGSRQSFGVSGTVVVTLVLV